MTREKLFEYIKSEYGVSGEFPWKKWPEYAIFRHVENSKWFAVFLVVSRSKFGLEDEENMEILNLKLDPILIYSLRQEEGIYPAYHMNKEYWVSVDIATYPDDNLYDLIEMSYNNTKKICKKINKK